MSKLEKVLSLMERMNYVGKPYMLMESQESSSQKEAIRYVEQHLGWSHEKANNFVRIDLRNDITALRDKKIGKFTLGVTRMFCNHELNNASIISDLNSTLKLLSAHLNEYDRNLNGLSAQELIQRFAQTRQNNFEAEKEEINAMEFGANSNYKIVPINTFEEAQQYYQYTNPDSRWCLTHMENMFDSYTCGGINQIYFCLQNGFENIPPKVGEGAPLDEYGLSMLSIIVNERGELAYCTTRWNHDNGGSDSSMSAKEVSQVVGVNFYAVFKPNNKWQELIAQVKQRLANGEHPSDVFDWVGIFKEGFAQVRLNRKYNFINQENHLLSDRWYGDALDFYQGFARVELNGKWNFINQEGQPINDQWYEWVYNFREGFARVKLNGRWGFINQKGQPINNQWYDWVWDFHEGFAGVKLNGEDYKLDTSGRLHNMNENKEYKTNKIKQRISLTESSLKQMIKESVKQVLSELDWKTYANAAKKRRQQYEEDPTNVKAWDSAYELNKMANQRFDDDYVGNFKYDTLLDKLRDKKSPKFYSNFDVNDKTFPQQAIRGTNKGGNDIFNTKKGRYYDNRACGGGYVNPNNFFRDKEVGEKFQDASDELWAYEDGDYEYQKGEGWKKR